MPDILIVDDESDILDVLSDFFGSQGFNTLTASSASEAMRILAMQSCDLVISDIRMPGADGFDLLKELRNLKKRIPVILITAHPNHSDLTRSIATGSYAYVEKPIDLCYLYSLVRTAMRRKYPLSAPAAAKG